MLSEPYFEAFLYKTGLKKKKQSRLFGGGGAALPLPGSANVSDGKEQKFIALMKLYYLTLLFIALYTGLVMAPHGHVTAVAPMAVCCVSA